MNPDRKYSIVVTVLCVLLLIALCGLYLLGLQQYKLKEYLPIMQAVGIIKDNYFYYDESVHESKLVDNAIDGLVSGTGDKYAEYYTEEEYKELLKDQSNTFVGIGISIAAPDDVGARILRVFEGSTMEQAGVIAGDIVLKINGKDTAGLTMDEMLALFTKDEKATDTLELLRGSDTFTVTVGKSEVYAPYVSYEMIADSIGYIKIDGFFGKVVSETKNAMEDLLAQGMQSVIIDVRDNPGGGLNEALEVSRLFLHRGDLIVTIMARNEQEESYSAKKDGYDLPVTILVNGESASGSELFTAALRDNGRAVVVGEKTFGKGIVQSFFKLRSNGGYVKITTDAYFTPKGVCIHHTGITPDIVVDLPEEYRGAIVSSVPREQDTQLETAIRAAEYQIGMNNTEDAA